MRLSFPCHLTCFRFITISCCFFFLHIHEIFLLLLVLQKRGHIIHTFLHLAFFFEFYLIYFFIQQLLISHPFYTHQCIHVNPSLAIHPTTPTPRCFPPLVSIHLVFTSVSLFLPCKPVHLYHFSRFYIYVLIHDICFSLSDLLHSV